MRSRILDFGNTRDVALAFFSRPGVQGCVGMSFFMRAIFSHIGNPIKFEHRRKERCGGCRGKHAACLHTDEASKQEAMKLFERAWKLWKDLCELSDSPEESESSSEKQPPTRKQRSQVKKTKAKHASPRRTSAAPAVSRARS